MKSLFVSPVGKALFALVALGSLSSLSAQSIIMTQDDFQGYTLNGALPTSAAGSHGAYSYGTNVINVVADPVTANVGNKVIAIASTPGGSTYLYGTGISGTNRTFNQLGAANQSLLFSYDVYISSANLNQFYVQLQYGDSGSNSLTTLYFKAPNAGNTALDYLVAGGSATSLGVTALAEHWYTVTYDIHQLENDSWAVSIGLLDKTTQTTSSLLTDQLLAVGDLDASVLRRLNFFQQNTATVGNLAYIDNVSLSIVTIPEPGTLAFAGVGLALVALFRRRKG